MEKYLGEEFLNKLYNDLHNSEIVMHTALKSDNKNQKLERYFNRLESITKRAYDANNLRRENDIEYLKKLYHKKYVIKPEDISENYFRMQQEIARNQGQGYKTYTEEEKAQEKRDIIKEQEDALDRWIDYLASEDAEIYPTWFKYYAFQGMLNLGNYIKEKNEYSRRTKSTFNPFIEINKEALAMVYENLISFLKKEEINEIELQILLRSGNFGKLYSYFKKVLDEVHKDDLKSDIGMWKKYNMGSDPKILFDDIHGKGTDWCTAGGIITAKKHLYGGDFYVYYTIDKEGNYTNPRIAIRKQDDLIAEIRGIASDQNLEPNMEKIVEEKLLDEDFPDREIYKKKVSDMQLMTCLYDKYRNNIELTKEELRFLYRIDAPILGFGYEEDPRIQEILNSRNKKKDLAFIFQCEENNISLNTNEALKENILFHYGDLYLLSLVNASKLILPKNVHGDLNLGALINSDEIILPEVINGNLILWNLLKTNKMKLPRKVNGNIEISNLTFIDELIMPEEINGNVDLKNLKEAKKIVFLNNINGSIDLNSLENIETLMLPKYLNGDLYLENLTNVKNIVMPEEINGNLYVSNINITLPLVHGDIYINGSIVNENERSKNM